MSIKHKVLNLISEAVALKEDDIWLNHQFQEWIVMISRLHKKLKAIRNNQFNWPKEHTNHFNLKIEGDKVCDSISEYIHEARMEGFNINYYPSSVRNQDDEWAVFKYKNINVTVLLSI